MALGQAGVTVMTKVVSLRGPRAPLADERMRFCLARREMNRAFSEWLCVEPNPADVQSEIDDTTSVLRQLRDLNGGR
jgi:hypothetical protein